MEVFRLRTDFFPKNIKSAESVSIEVKFCLRDGVWTGTLVEAENWLPTWLTTALDLA